MHGLSAFLKVNSMKSLKIELLNAVREADNGPNIRQCLRLSQRCCPDEVLIR
jgi:hypothetical protein